MGLPMAEQSNPLLESQPQPSIGFPIQESPTTRILLPYQLRPRCRRRCVPSLLSNSSTLLYVSILLVLLSLSFLLLFPSDPTSSLSRLHLQRLRISPPSVTLSVSLSLRIRNPNFFSLDYNSINVSIGYRGERLGVVNLDDGRIRARAVSYVDAEMVLDGVRIVKDMVYLVGDVARGQVPFETVSEIDGRLHLFFLDIPVHGKISCTAIVNPRNQTVTRQDCLPEGKISCTAIVNPRNQTVTRQDCLPE